MSYPFKSALELRDAIVSKEVSPVEVVTASIDRMQSLEPLLNAFVTQTPELALSAARAAEKAVMRGERLGALHGLPQVAHSHSHLEPRPFPTCLESTMPLS